MRLSIFLLCGFQMFIGQATASYKDWGDDWNQPKSDGWTIGISHGTTAFGLDVSYAFTETFSLRGSYRGGSISFDADSDGIDYDGKLKLGGGFLLADFTPFDWKGFVFSVGASANKFRFESEARCNNPGGCKVGNQTFSPAQLGELSAEMKFWDFAPYAGIGIGTPWVRKHPGFAIRGELGLMLIGKPNVDVTSNSAACNTDPSCRSALRKEESELEDDAKYFPFYPVLNLIIGYTF